MSLIVIVIIAQAVSSTLAWLGFYVGIRALPGARARQSRWVLGSAMVAAAWLIGIQVFRVLGSVWLVRYFAGGLPGLFALPAGIGDVATGLLAPFVAYAWYSGKPYARSAAIAWNLFGMADLVNAVVLGTLTN